LQHRTNKPFFFLNNIADEMHINNAFSKEKYVKNKVIARNNTIIYNIVNACCHLTACMEIAYVIGPFTYSDLMIPRKATCINHRYSFIIFAIIWYNLIIKTKINIRHVCLLISTTNRLVGEVMFACELHIEFQMNTITIAKITVVVSGYSHYP